MRALLVTCLRAAAATQVGPTSGWRCPGIYLLGMRPARHAVISAVLDRYFRAAAGDDHAPTSSTSSSLLNAVQLRLHPGATIVQSELGPRRAYQLNQYRSHHAENDPDPGRTATRRERRPVPLTLGHEQCIFAGSQRLKRSITQVLTAHDAITVSGATPRFTPGRQCPTQSMRVSVRTGISRLVLF